MINRMIFSSQNDVDGSVKDILEPMIENKDNDSLSSILSEIDHHSHENNHIFTNSPSPSFSSSSNSTSSSSSNNTSISTNDYPYNETDEDSVETKKKEIYQEIK